MLRTRTVAGARADDHDLRGQPTSRDDTAAHPASPRPPSLHLDPSPDLENRNSRPYLDKCCALILENLRSLAAAPSVQFQDVPPDWAVREAEDGLRDGGGSASADARAGGPGAASAGRLFGGRGVLDGRREHDAELYDGDGDVDRDRGGGGGGEAEVAAADAASAAREPAPSPPDAAPDDNAAVGDGSAILPPVGATAAEAEATLQSSAAAAAVGEASAEADTDADAGPGEGLLLAGGAGGGAEWGAAAAAGATAAGADTAADL